MVEKTTTIMVLEVDLQCHRCYKKVKKVLCKIPQVQDQVYDEKKNLVMIKVVCCSPEKIKQKIICKCGDSIKSIEIKQPPKPEEPKKPKDPPKPAGKPTAPEKPKDPPKPAEKPKDPPKPAEKPKESEKPKEKPANPPKPAEKPNESEKPKEKPANPPKPAEKPKEPEKPKEKPADPPNPPEKPKEPAPAPAPKPPVVVPCYPVLPAGYPIGTCCSSCYEGRGGGPCFHGHGGPPPSYEGNGRPVYDSYGGGYYRPDCYVSRCDYFNEENTAGCTIM